jgi:hypothetical protein
MQKELVEPTPSLTDAEWMALVKRLTLHADWKLSRLYWRGVPAWKGGAVPGGVEPGDLAEEAIQLFLDGTRVWDREKCPEGLQDPVWVASSVPG